MEPEQHHGTAQIEPQPLRPRRQGANLLRVARVILVLVSAMAAGAGLCYAVMPDAEPVVKPELRRPQTIFPPGILSLRLWRSTTASASSWSATSMRVGRLENRWTR